MTSRLRGPAALALLFVLVAPSSALGQSPERAEARERFERGLALYDEGRFDAALAELTRAHELAPSATVLFNLGRVHARLGHPVESTEAFERYLEGGASLPAAQREAAERELQIQRSRIAYLTVEANVDGASINVDGASAGRTPLARELRLAAGDHVIAVGAPGYESEPRRLSLAGGVHESVRFELRETGSLRGSLRVRTALPGVSVLVDDEPQGVTPLSRSLSVSAGRHRVRAERSGYLGIEREVVVDIGAESELAFTLERDPDAPRDLLGTLRLALPGGAAVRVDGAASDEARTLELPVGPHRLLVEAPDRAPLELDVEVEAGASRDLALPLRWTPEARHEQVSSAESRRVASAALTVTGSLLLALGAATLIAAEVRHGELDLDARRQVFEACPVGLGSFPASCYGPLFPWGIDEAELERDEAYAQRARGEFDGDVDEINALRAVGWVAAAVGAVGTLVSVIVLATTPSEEDVDAAASRAHLELRVGPTGVALAGSL
ncbi:MAG: PEGA domain-containing protein [Sandaracinaceae bacterium]|nr:PEGA domain-containing protein [Sandaracinaceae bacterium]